jgi:hypothetical protein
MASGRDDSDYQFNFDDDLSGSRQTPPVGGGWDSSTSQNPIGGTGRPTDPFGNPINESTFYTATYTSTPMVVNRPPKSRAGCLVAFILLMTCGLPIFIIALVAIPLVGSMGGSGDFMEGINQLISQVTEGLAAPYSEPVVGDAANFSPMDGLAQATRLAGEGAQFAEFDFTGVRSDGTMDLTDTSLNASAEYVFLRPVPQPADAPPVGSPGNTGGPWFEPIRLRAYQPGQFRTRRTSGGGVSTSIQYINQGMEMQIDEPTTSPFEEIAPVPTCSLADLWAEAISDFDAPADGVANISYEEGQYEFRMSTGVNITFTDGCKVLGR